MEYFCTVHERFVHLRRWRCFILNGGGDATTAGLVLLYTWSNWRDMKIVSFEANAKVSAGKRNFNATLVTLDEDPLELEATITASHTKI
jgi:hypothetical protein